jgi:hypothetical protein
MILQVGHHRQLSPVERCVANAIDALIGHDLERHEIATWAGNNDFSGCDLHGAIESFGLTLCIEFILDQSHLACQV